MYPPILVAACLSISNPALRPTWPFSWETLPVWGSGQGSSDFSPAVVSLLSRYRVLWTQGQQMPEACDSIRKDGGRCPWGKACSGEITRDWIKCRDGAKGYENFENCTATDAGKIHAVNHTIPVMGYYGFYGCCSGYYSWWWEDYNSTANSELWLRDDDGRTCFSDTDTSRGPIYDLCNPRMMDYYKGKILASITEPGSGVAGAFFDEVDHFVMPLSLGGRDFYHCKMSAGRKLAVKACFVDAMVSLTRYLASKGKYSIMSTKALQKQYPAFFSAQFTVLNETKAFYYQESFCPNKTKPPDSHSGLHYCKQLHYFKPST